MHPLPSFAEAAELAIQEFEILKPLIPTYTHLILSTLFALYIGSHASLSRPSSAKKKPKEDTADDEFDEVIVQKMGWLEPSDAIMFPILSGITLTGLYLLIKNFDPKYLNTVLNWYFSHASFLFAIAFVRDAITIFRSFIFPSRYIHGGVLWRANQERRIFEATYPSNAASNTRRSPLPGILGKMPLPPIAQSYLWRLRGISYQKANLHAYVRSFMDMKVRFNVIDILGVVFAAAAVIYSIFGSRPWWITNFLGFCFSYGALQFLSPSTFWTGTLILSSLLFYDIYFVFFTPMMVTVATKLDIPIKLVFPRPPPPGQSVGAEAMLGLGDIVVPGMIIGLALRFDLYLYYLRIQKQRAHLDADEDHRIEYVNATGGWGERIWRLGQKETNVSDEDKKYYEAKTFPKTYFTASLVGYVFGIMATLLSMQLSKHPQPALLFLVPGVLTSLWGTALFKGEIQSMWDYSDEVEDEDNTGNESAEKSEESIETGFLGKLLGPEWAKWFIGKYTKDSPVSTDGQSICDQTIPEKGKPKDVHSGGQEKRSEKERVSRSPSELISISISLPSEAEAEAQLKVNTTPPEMMASASLDREESLLKNRRGYVTSN